MDELKTMDELRVETLALAAQAVAGILRKGDEVATRRCIRRLAGQGDQALSGVLGRLSAGDRDHVREIVESHAIRLSDRQRRRFLGLLERKI